MNGIPQSNEIVTVSSCIDGVGSIDYVDDYDCMTIMDRSNLEKMRKEGLIPESVLLHHALCSLEDAEDRCANLVALVDILRKKIGRLNK